MCKEADVQQPNDMNRISEQGKDIIPTEQALPPISHSTSLSKEQNQNDKQKENKLQCYDLSEISGG